MSQITVNQNDTRQNFLNQIKSIDRYISRAIDNTSSEHLGLELEHFIVRAFDNAHVPYHGDKNAGIFGVVDVLQALRPYYREAVWEPQEDGSKCLIGLSRELANITLEPGSQLEISIGPVSKIAEIEREYQKFLGELEPILLAMNLKLVTLGYHPHAMAKDIELLPKQRYAYMDKHFARKGHHGLCMMRATASTQVSIDYFSLQDAVTKFKIANLLSPLLAFITDNSPIFEAEKLSSIASQRSLSGLEIPKRMVRTHIWNDVDADRSMTMSLCFDDDFDFAKYAKHLLSKPAIFDFTPSNLGYLNDMTFAELLADETEALDTATIEHILSLFFFDVRFKTYVEIRSADSMPIEYALAYAALIKGIFYNKEAMNKLSSLLSGYDKKDIDAAKRALDRDGFDALVYERSAGTWLQELVEAATGFLPADEQDYLEPIKQLIEQKVCLLDLAKL